MILGLTRNNVSTNALLVGCIIGLSVGSLSVRHLLSPASISGVAYADAAGPSADAANHTRQADALLLSVYASNVYALFVGGLSGVDIVQTVLISLLLMCNSSDKGRTDAALSLSVLCGVRYFKRPCYRAISH